jgi:hypothetical protein
VLVTGQLTAVAALTTLLLAPPSASAQEPPILKHSIREIEDSVRADTNDGRLQYYLALAPRRLSDVRADAERHLVALKQE